MYWNQFTEYQKHRAEQNIKAAFESTTKDSIVFGGRLNTLNGHARTDTPEFQGLTKLKTLSDDLNQKLRKLKDTEMKIPSGWPGVLSVGASDVFDSCDKQYHGSG